jgi:effector-binding domain-containing protein
MKILKIIGIVLLVLVALIVILGIIAPDEYSVERSAVINSPRQLVFNQVKYWRNWQAWSPWAELDTAMQETIEGVDGEKGANYRWSGEVIGKGEMLNTGVKEYEEVDYHLHFIEPMESTADGFFRLSGENGGSPATKVTWSMSGDNPFPWNVLMLFMSMDKMIGTDFEKGLEKLKALSEKEYAGVRQYQIKVEDFSGKNYAVIRQEVKFEAIKDFFTQGYAKIGKTLSEKKLKPAGGPAGLYFMYDEQKQITDMAAAVPVKGKVETEEIKMYTIPAGKTYVVDYYGPYEQMGNAYKGLDLYLATNGLKHKAPVLEEYITDPGAEPDSGKWLTRIYFFTE